MDNAPRKHGQYLVWDNDFKRYGIGLFGEDGWWVVRPTMYGEKLCAVTRSQLFYIWWQPLPTAPMEQA